MVIKTANSGSLKPRPLTESIVLQLPLETTQRPPPVIIPQSVNYGNFYGRPLLSGACFGCAHIFCAIAAIILGTLCYIWKSDNYYFGAGIWAGVFYLVNGLVALRAYTKGGNRMPSIVAHLSLSLLTAAVNVVVFTFSYLGYRRGSESYHMLPDDERMHWFNYMKCQIVFNLALILIVGLESVASMLSAIFIWKRLCSDTKKQEIVPFTVTF